MERLRDSLHKLYTSVDTFRLPYGGILLSEAREFNRS